MSSVGLLKHYDRISEAPDAIVKLRRLVLDFAVRGKLVEQDPLEGDASDALRQLATESVTSGARVKLLGQPSNVPFAIPHSWSWVRFSTIADFSAGRTPPRHESSLWNTGDYPWVSISDMSDGGFLTSTKETISKAAAKHVFKAEPSSPGTMIMSFKLTIGKIARLMVPAYHNEAIISIKPKIAEFDPYLFKVLPMFARLGNTKGAIKGATLNRDSISNIHIPLPPIPEQRRIVAKVDELMALCDELEAARTKREATRDRLTAASLARLNAPVTETFAVDANFALDVLPALTARIDQVKKLRNTILNLAVRGKLVAQNRSERSAKELLNSMNSGWSGELAGAGEARQVLPDGWEYAKLDHCLVVTGGIQKTPARAPREHAHPYLSVANVHRNRLSLTEIKKFELAPGELERYRLVPSDILVVEGNGSASEIGRCAVWRGEISDCVHQNHLIRCRPRNVEITPFISLYLNSPDGMDVMKQLAITSAGLFSLSVGKIRQIRLALPPIEEQRRIVARVDELMALCDELEASLESADDTRRRLLDALLHEALAPVSKPSNEHARAAVSGYLVSRLASKRNFGRTAHMKHLYFAESLLGLNLGGRYMREAAGPLDTGIYELEKRAEAAGWYTHSVETLPSGNEKVSYQPGGALKALAEEGITVLGRSRAEMDRLIDLMGSFKTETVEIIATLFAAWNDALLDGQNPDDNWIIKEVREHWHVSKQRFTPADLKKWLGWMRQSNVVPLGHQPRTMQQTTIEF